jgi:hypothetical protein
MARKTAENLSSRWLTLRIGENLKLHPELEDFVDLAVEHLVRKTQAGMPTRAMPPATAVLVHGDR